MSLIPDETEMLELLKRIHAKIDDLQTAGMSEAAIVTAIMGAVVERLLRAGGITATADYLRQQAKLVEATGPTLLTEIVR